MKKIILLIVLGVLAVIAIVGYLAFKNLTADQVTLQIEKEVVSSDKRTLDFSKFGLDNFTKYDVINDLIIDQPIERIQEALVAREFTTVELCQYYLTRIQKYEDVNAVIQLNDKILEQAKKVDSAIENGELLPLTGVIVLAKDNIAVEGMNTSAGSYALRDVYTTRHATVVNNLVDKGALIIGKANLSEFSNYMSLPSSSGFSVLGGQTKNPYGKYDVGGSSSGSSVAAALNLATVTLGSETAGSLIFPAGQNSVVALKPTIGLVSRDLIIPISEAQDTAGVEARFVKDLEKVFHEIVAIDNHDKATSIVANYDNSVNFDAATLNGVTFATYPTDNPELLSIIEVIKANGGTVVEKAYPEANIDMLSVLKHGINYDMAAFLQNEAVVSDIKSLDEIVEFYKSNSDKAPFGIYYLEDGLKADSNVDALIASNEKASREALDKMLLDVDFILSTSNELSGIYAPAGYPAITVPAGYKENGEPYGVTFVAGYLEDNKLIEIGYAFEEATKARKAIK